MARLFFARTKAAFEAKPGNSIIYVEQGEEVDEDFETVSNLFERIESAALGSRSDLEVNLYRTSYSV